MDKSPDAFRTISEVADWLGVPTHVLRFWESRFSQVKPVKRAGGRRYYRPADMLLLGGIKRLLHDDGLTIRGVQKMLREEGVRHVSSFSQPLDAMGPMRDVTEDVAPSPMAVDVEPEPLDNVIPLGGDGAVGKTDRSGPLVLGTPAERDGTADETPPNEPDAPGDAEQPATAQVRRDGDKAEEAAAAERDELPGPDAVDTTPASGEPVPAPMEAADPAEPPAPDFSGEPEPEDRMPEFSFLRRGAVPPAATPQGELFAEQRPEPPPRAIPPTPHVPEVDAADDDPSTPALPGMAARLAVARLRPDHAAIAAVVADLRALRARL
jgi:DNA-binding transcriptional MerR regulator